MRHHIPDTARALSTAAVALLVILATVVVIGPSETAAESPPVVATPAIASGYAHNCAVSAYGLVWCWGANFSGQLGDGTKVSALGPVPVQGLTGVTQVAAGYEHTCALLADTTVKCWGANQIGQLGDGTNNPHLTPTTVPGLTGVTDIGAAGWGTCAVLAGGSVDCWGRSNHGAIGDGGTTPRLSPTPVTGLTGAVTLAMGYDHHCAARVDKTVACWGYAAGGGFGDVPDNHPDRPIAAEVPRLTGVVSLAGGLGHTCAVLDDATLDCWGGNANGQIGAETPPIAWSPVQVAGVSGVAHVATGLVHTCAALLSGKVRCWGFNRNGQLGDNTTVSRSAATDVVGLSNVTQISAGENHTCAVLSDGTAKCWGANGGTLGDGTVTQRLTPVTVKGLHLIDTTTPTLSVSTNAMPVFTLSGRARLTYNSKNAASFDVRYRKGSYHSSALGAWVYPAEWQAATASWAQVPAAAGWTYCLSVRARDAAGNTSPWSPPRCTTAPVDDRSLRRSNGWAQNRRGAAYLHTLTAATKTGKTLTLRKVHAARIAVLAQTCGACGHLRVYWNGKVIKTVSLHSKATKDRRVLTVASFPSVRVGTLTMKSTGNSRVAVDGLGVVLR